MSNYPQAEIRTSKGTVTVELWDDVAPKHVESFLKLSQDGFYNDLAFHRIIPNFVIQGGCPDGTGMGGPGYTIDAEFNDRKHDLGVLSMARSADPNSAGSQFFICLGRDHCQHLDGKYTAFGKVIDGLDIVREIGASPTDGNDRPVTPITMECVTPVEA